MTLNRKILSLLLTAAMVLALGPVFTQDAFAGGIPYIDEYGEPGMVEDVTWITDQTELVAGWYAVNGDVEINDRITVSGDVHLILADGCDFKAKEGINVASGKSLTIYGQSENTGELTAKGDYYQAGIGGDRDQAGGTVTINGGTVDARGGEFDDFIGGGSGIGGGDGGDGGTVTINGGTVTANGGDGSAGIGGGGQRAGGTVTINGGTVTANGKGGAGIGGGSGQAGGTVIINGGTVTANGIGGAGIGGANGTYGDGGTVTINGGTVTATGGAGGAGIGGGDGKNDTGTLDITNAIVFASSATAGTTGAGRKNAVLVTNSSTDFYDAAGNNTADGTITLSGDYVIPAGKTLTIPSNIKLVLESGTIVNNGTIDNGGTIIGGGEISGGAITGNAIQYPYIDEDGSSKFTTGTVTVITGATDIFNDGWYIVKGTVSLSGLTVNATSEGARLILADGCDFTVNGGINVESGKSLTIYGQSGGTGKLTATGGSSGQAGIGGSTGGGAGGEVTINGGTITATGGNGGAAGIGGGDQGGFGGTVTINGGTVTATGGWDGTGIGSGAYGAGGNVTINGGTVTANGDGGGAGIGSGAYGAGGEITISGGTVTANGGDYGGAGIGDGTIDITSAIVFASSVTAATSSTNAILVIGGTTEFYDAGGSVTGAGAVTLNGDYVIPSGRTIIVPDDKTLDLADGSLTVNGTLEDEGNGSIIGEGTLTNNGSVAISLASVTDNNESYTYNGGAIIPDLTVQIAGTTLINDTDYGISASSNTDVGTASYTITGLGHFTVTKNGSFTIGMATPEILTQPAAADIYNGMPLSSSNLSGGAANVPGTFTWTTGAYVPAASGDYSVTFTPNDAANYKTALGTAHVTVIVLDVAGLLTLIETAKTKITGATYGDKNGDYPETAKINLTAVIGAATTTASAIGIPQADITEAADILDTAIATFDAAKIVVNFAGLKAKIDEANAISRGNYTAATWTTLKDAIADAEATLGGYVTQTEADDMTEALAGAIGGLIGAGGSGGGNTGNPTNPANPTNPPPSIPGGGTVTAPADNPPVSNPDGSVTLPGGGAVETPRGVTVTVPEGSVVTPDGSISFPQGSGGGAVELPGGYTLNLPENAVVIIDENAPLGYSVEIENPFKDLAQNDWFYGDAMFAYSHGLLNGTGAAEYSPGMPTTRGMVVAVLHRLESEPDASTENMFSDVANEEYYTKAVTWAAGEGIVEGYGDEIFRPDFDITRQELAAVLLRLANHKGLKLPAVREYTAFADDTNISGYAREAVETLYEAGIISGKPGNIFDPKGTATRAEAAAILHRFLEAAGK